jgi:hypothetical protein
LYFAKTIDASVFDDGIKKQSIVNKGDAAAAESTLKKEFLSHRIIKLSVCD